MANLILYTESIEDATITIATLGEDASQPKENFQDTNENTKWKAGTSNVSGHFQFDLGSTRAVDFLILGAHNYSTTFIGIKLSHDDNDDSGFGDETFNIGSLGAYHDFVTADLNTWLETFSTFTKRHWRLYLEAQGSTTFQEIGTVYLGTTFQPTLNRNWGQREGKLTNVSQRSTIGQQQFTNKNGVIRKTFSLIHFRDIQETQKDNTLTFIQNVENNHIPFYFDPIGDGSEIFVRMQGSEHGLHDTDFQNYNSDQFRFVEEI